MPYKISAEGLDYATSLLALDPTDELTIMQQEAMQYALYLHNHHPDQFVHAAEVAKYWDYPNGQFFRGVLASLHKKGLLNKFEGDEA